jgi:hypothetical protein
MHKHHVRLADIVETAYSLLIATSVRLLCRFPFMFRKAKKTALLLHARGNDPIKAARARAYLKKWFDE